MDGLRLLSLIAILALAIGSLGFFWFVAGDAISTRETNGPFWSAIGYMVVGLAGFGVGLKLLDLFIAQIRS